MVGLQLCPTIFDNLRDLRIKRKKKYPQMTQISQMQRITILHCNNGNYSRTVNGYEHFNVEMASGFVGEDEAGKERKRRHIGGYDGVFVTLTAEAGTRREMPDQP